MTNRRGLAPECLLSVEDVAELLKVPVSRVYEGTRKRGERIPGFRLGKYWRFRMEDVLGWLERQRSGRAPKTEAREAGVYVVPLLRKVLAKYKASYPSVSEGWIFRGGKCCEPLDLDNLSRRDIPQDIDGAWFGWHAFRRGLGTRLNAAGVDDTEIQSILRHADVSTTQAFYILPNQERAEVGLRKLDKTLRTKYGIKG
jgi:excisionase family DNA binding protein